MRSFRVMRFRGVEVVGDASLAALVLVLGWVVYLELRLPVVGASQLTASLIAAVSGTLFLATVLAHELSHTAMAQRRGIVVKQIRMMVVGGTSELEAEVGSPENELAIALVGPLTSGGLGALLLVLGAALSDVAALSSGLRFVGLANVVLAVFNLLPGLPLDGGRVLRAILWRRSGDRDQATESSIKAGRIAGLLLVGFGVVVTFRGFGGLGLWVVLGGWYLSRIATLSGRSHGLEVATRDRTVGSVMRPVTESIQGSRTVSEAVDLYQIGPRLRTQVVEVDGHIVGLLGEREVGRIETDARDSTAAKTAMTRIGPSDVVDVATPLIEALRQEAGPTRHIVATEGGRVVGLIGPRELAAALRYDENGG